jgi:hypothetical protein
LITGHAYSIIGVATYNGTNLVKIRNPWGSEGWAGPWSDSDTKRMNAAA